MREHADNVAAGFFVAFELQHVSRLRFFQQRVERAEAVIGFVEDRLAAFTPSLYLHGRKNRFARAIPRNLPT